MAATTVHAENVTDFTRIHIELICDRKPGTKFFPEHGTLREEHPTLRMMDCPPTRSTIRTSTICPGILQVAALRHLVQNCRKIQKVPIARATQI
jgi:hypothetical protein